LRYQPKKFLLNAARAFSVMPVPDPVPRRNEAKLDPVLGSAAFGSGPCVKVGPKEKFA
jgi:hypothetical protein